jgi:UDP-N-acetylglucosamine:LPS N-acetylglucosamine transferase
VKKLAYQVASGRVMMQAAQVHDTAARIHVLVVMGEGGHTKQCLRLVDLLGTTDYRYSYILVAEDQVTEAKLRVPGAVYRVARPGSTKSRLLVRLAKLPLCTLESAVAVLCARPDAVLSTGPGVAVPICVVAKLLGAWIIYVESFSRVRRLSLSGRLLRPLANLFFVQWEELRPAVPGAVYAGRLY